MRTVILRGAGQGRRISSLIMKERSPCGSAIKGRGERGTREGLMYRAYAGHRERNKERGALFRGTRSRSFSKETPNGTPRSKPEPVLSGIGVSATPLHA
ncbi:MAG: hypothetical protein LBP19_02360 [Treponema sp.]|nr:hypothetical protein [Treponema sp.]